MLKNIKNLKIEIYGKYVPYQKYCLAYSAYYGRAIVAPLFPAMRTQC